MAEFEMKKARILIVEDEAVVAENLEMAITDVGYEVVGRAASADDAINAAIEFKPDLILMDIVLFGQKNGIDASYEIKEKLDIPIIFLTAYSDLELVDRAKNTEPYAYIVKPFQERQLFASIEMALHNSQIVRKLKESETKSRDLVELLPQTVFETDERGNLIFTNRAGFDYFGYAQEDFNGGLTALQMISPEDRDRAKENIGRVMKGEQLGGVEYMVQRKDGSTFPVIIYATPIIHENKPVGMRGVIADITERKQAEAKLLESEEQYRILVEHSPLGIFKADTRGNIEIANPALLRMLGSHSEEATRQVNLLTYPLLIEAGVSKLVKECMEKGESLNSEFPYRSKWEKDVYCNLFLTPVHNTTGKVSGVQGIIEDITERKRMEEALLLSESEKKSILNAISDIVVFQDSSLSIRWVNEAAAQSVGKTPQELVGCHCYEMWHGRSEPCEGCPILRTIETESSASSIMRTPDGRWWEVVGETVHDNAGKTVGVIEVARDITERKAAEEALQESEEKLDSMLRSIGDHISMMDKDLNIIWANETARNIFGNDIIGKKCYEVYHRRKEPCEPYPCLTLKAFQDGGGHEHDTQVIGQDGEIIYFHCTANVALKDDEGKPAAVIEISRDITERILAGEALRESEERYRRMVANVPGMVYQFVLHPDGSMALPFVSESCRELFGMEPHEIRRDANILFNLIHPDDRSGFYRSIADSAESLSPWGWEGRGIVSGEERWFQCISRPEQRVNGDILWDGLIMEITERKLAEKRIEEEYRRAEFYIDLMGHDINNINQVTSGYLDLILQTPDLPDESRKHTEIALNHVRKSAGIISDVKAISEVRSGEIELAKIDICPAYRSAVEAVMSGSRDVRINSTITEGRHFTRGDAMLYSVFSNLLNNAVKFDRHDIVKIDVDISPSDDDRYWKLEFKDRGRGISDDYKNIIFNRLERAGESAQGTGLGLTIVKYIVVSYGGSIKVEDRVKGDRAQGSNFIVLLPKGV